MGCTSVMRGQTKLIITLIGEGICYVSKCDFIFVLSMDLSWAVLFRFTIRVNRLVHFKRLHTV